MAVAASRFDLLLDELRQQHEREVQALRRELSRFSGGALMLLDGDGALPVGRSSVTALSSSALEHAIVRKSIAPPREASLRPSNGRVMVRARTLGESHGKLGSYDDDAPLVAVRTSMPLPGQPAADAADAADDAGGGGGAPPPDAVARTDSSINGHPVKISLHCGDPFTSVLPDAPTTGDGSAAASGADLELNSVSACSLVDRLDSLQSQKEEDREKEESPKAKRGHLVLDLDLTVPPEGEAPLLDSGDERGDSLLDSETPRHETSVLAAKVSRVDSKDLPANATKRRMQILPNLGVKTALAFSDALDDEEDGHEALSPKDSIFLHDQWLELEQDVNLGLIRWSTEKARDKLRQPKALQRKETGIMAAARKLDIVTRCSQRLVANPSSRKRLWWDALGVLLLLGDLIVVPLQVFALKDTDFQIVVRWFSAGFWTLDIFLSFFVGYHRRGIVEMNLGKICRHYLLSWFWMDITLVALDWAFLFLTTFAVNSDSVGGTKTQGAARAAKISRFMRALRLLRLMKFRVVVSDLSHRIRTEELRTFIYIVKLILIIIFVNHFVGCCFYGLHWLHGSLYHSIEPDRTWVARTFKATDTANYRYWTSLHWSLTQFTPASMEVVPVNEIERFYTVCVLLFALVTFSSFISSITTAMTLLRQHNSRKLMEELSLRRFLVEHGISTELTHRVMHFVHERSYTLKLQARSSEDNTELVKILPESLKHALRKEFFLPILTGHPFFHMLAAVDPEVLPMVCKRSLVEKHLVRRDEIFGNGKEVTHMLFIVSGTLGYSYSLNQVDLTERLKAPMWACEIVLWTQYPEQANAFVAESPHCDLAMLSAAEFRNVATAFHSISKGLVRYAASFVSEAQQMSRVCRKQLVVGVDHDRVKEKVDGAFDYLVDPTTKFALGGKKRSFMLLERSPTNGSGGRRQSLGTAAAAAAAPRRDSLGSIADAVKAIGATIVGGGRWETESEEEEDDYPDNGPRRTYGDAS